MISPEGYTAITLFPHPLKIGLDADDQAQAVGRRRLVHCQHGANTGGVEESSKHHSVFRLAPRVWLVKYTRGGSGGEP